MIINIFWIRVGINDVVKICFDSESLLSDHFEGNVLMFMFDIQHRRNQPLR